MKELLTPIELLRKSRSRFDLLEVSDIERAWWLYHRANDNVETPAGMLIKASITILIGGAFALLTTIAAPVFLSVIAYAFIRLGIGMWKEFHRPKRIQDYHNWIANLRRQAEPFS